MKLKLSIFVQENPSHHSAAHLGPIQISMMELFYKND